MVAARKKAEETEVTAPAEEEGAVAQPEAAEEEAPRGSAVTVRYLDHAGVPTERTFSKEVHGADFAKLAKEFCTTNAERILKD